MKKVLTIIIDGFGIRGDSKDNAVSQAKMHSYEQFFKDHPHTALDCSLDANGRLKNEELSCEMAHKLLGCGRKLHSKDFLINEFWSNVENNTELEKLKLTCDKPTHLFCFLKKDNIKNVINCINFLRKNGFVKLYIHAIVFNDFAPMLQKFYKSVGEQYIYSIAGSEYIKDSNEDNVLTYYNTITNRNSTYESIETHISKYDDYKYIKPAVSKIKYSFDMDDNVIWLDQSLDNTKIVKAYAELGANVYTYFKIDKDDRFSYFIEDESDDNSLGVYLSKLDVKQARVAEDVKADSLFKYFDSNTRKLNNYDKYKVDSVLDRPEMSIINVTKKAIDLMDKDYAFIVVNFANCDVFGKQQDMNLAIQACMSVDVCLGKLIEEAENNFYTIVVISDHGRIESVNHTKKISSLVPFIISDDKVSLKDGGTLSNFAPTLLDYMDIKIPEEMTSESLLIR